MLGLDPSLAACSAGSCLVVHELLAEDREKIILQLRLAPRGLASNSGVGPWHAVRLMGYCGRIMKQRREAA